MKCKKKRPKNAQKINKKCEKLFEKIDILRKKWNFKNFSFKNKTFIFF